MLLLLVPAVRIAAERIIICAILPLAAFVASAFGHNAEVKLARVAWRRQCHLAAAVSDVAKAPIRAMPTK